MRTSHEQPGVGRPQTTEEAQGRNARKQSMMTRLAGFPAVKTLDEFSFEFAKGVKRSQIEELA